MSESAWTPQVFAPYDRGPDVLFARIAVRSPHFDTIGPSADRSIIVGSAAGHHRDRVAASARGELLERVGNILAGRAAEAEASMMGTYAELRRRGVPVLDPAASDSTHPAPIPEATRTTRRLWVLGHRVGTGEETYLPAGAVFLRHRPPTGCDPGPIAGSTGVAAHPDPAAAADHAAWELLERDLIRRSWYAHDPPPTTIPTPDLPDPLAKLLPELGLAATTLDLAAPPGARCVVVCLHAPDGTRQSFGARCGPEAILPTLVEKAAYEALMVRWSMSTAVARDTWERWRGSSAPETAVQHALWAYHVQDGLGLWTAPAGGSTARGAATGAGAAVREVGAARERASETDRTRATDRPRTSDRAPLSQAAVTPDRAPAHRPGPELPVHSGQAALSAHTGRDVVLVDTTAGPARAAGTTVIRIVAPGATALPPGPEDTRHPTSSSRGPHPFG